MAFCIRTPISLHSVFRYGRFFFELLSAFFARSRSKGRINKWNGKQNMESGRNCFGYSRLRKSCTGKEVFAPGLLSPTLINLTANSELNCRPKLTGPELAWRLELIRAQIRIHVL